MEEPSQNQKPKLILKTENLERCALSRPESEAPPSVHEMLQQNRATEAAFAKPLILNKKPTRRRKDYLISLLLGNGLICLTVALLPINVVTLVYGFSGIVLYTIGLTWIMWGVMSNY